MLIVTENNISLATGPLSPAESQALTLWVTTHKAHDVNKRLKASTEKRDVIFKKRTPNNKCKPDSGEV